MQTVGERNLNDFIESVHAQVGFDGRKESRYLMWTVPEAVKNRPGWFARDTDELPVVYIRPDFRVCPVWHGAQLVQPQQGGNQDTPPNELLDDSRVLDVQATYNLGVEQQVICNNYDWSRKIRRPIKNS